LSRRLKTGPYAVKPYHYASLINTKGGVSPLCADRPRALNLKVSLWTLRPEAVTCPECLKRLAELQPVGVFREDDRPASHEQLGPDEVDP
jgi:hypothetical protein